jgi:membrane protein YfhO
VPWRVGVLLALLPLAFTGKAFLRGDLYGPADLYYGHDPWRGVAAENGIRGVANPILSDLAFANIPWRAAVREALVNGRLPLWNRFVLAGNPLLATAQASVFHPATWLGIFLPLAQSWTFSCAFTIFLALLCAHLFFRDFCSSEPAALVGAVGWGFSTYVLFWDGWAVGPSIASFPLLLLGLRRLTRAPGGGGVGITTAALALSFHGGHPETFLHCVAAGAVYFLWEIFPREERRRARRAVGGALAAGLLAFGLAAPVLVPLLEALPHSAEYAARRAALAEGRPRQSVPAGEAARRLRPAILPFAHGIYGRSPVQERRQDGSGMPLGYAGAVLFPLAAVGAFGRRPRERWIFLGLFLAGLAYGASTPILLDVTSRLPGFSLALNYRLVFLAPLGLAGLAALGADRLVERRSAARELAIAAAAAVALLSVSFLLSRGIFRERALPTDFVAASFAAEGLPVLLLGLAALLGKTRERNVVTAAAVLLVSQRYLEMRGVYPTLPSRSLVPALPTLAALPEGGDPYRVVAVGGDFRPNGAALFGREDVRGYESLVLRRFEETYPLWCRRQFASHNRVDDLGAPFLSFLNARYAISEADAAAPGGWALVTRGADLALFENRRALPRAFVPRRIRAEPQVTKQIEEMGETKDFGDVAWVDRADPAGEENGSAVLTVHEIGPDLVIDADVGKRVLIVTSVPDWPGWRAGVAGKELALTTVNHAFVGFWLPPGRHEVRLRYLPQSFCAGAALAGAVLVAGLLLVLTRRRGLT